MSGHRRSTETLPKSHLHIHADGSFPRDAVHELARRRGGSAPEPTERFDDTEEFFRRYTQVCDLSGSLDDLAGLCAALVASEREHGVTYLEVGVEPQMYAPRLGSLDEVLAAMVAGYRQGAAAEGMEVGCMVGVNTDHPVALAEEVADSAVRFAGEGVVAFGTAGFVEPAGLSRFRPAVDRARSAGLRIVSHAGQVGGPESVVEALDELEPDRIAHGINAARDPAVLERLAVEGVVCDVCVTSNVRLAMVPSYEEHPLPRMLEAGVPVTLNADDEYWFGSSIAREYEVARDLFDLSDQDLARIALAGTNRTGMSEETRRSMIEGIETWLSVDPS
ncbi:MAG: adenosine deaminase [Actinomycetota bacterium]